MGDRISSTQGSMSTAPTPGLVREEVLAIDAATAVGPVFIANILNWMLMGTLIMQVYTYYQKFRTDRMFIRILVYALLVVDITQTIMLTHHGWWALVAIWGRPDQLDVLTWSAAMMPLMCGIVSIMVQFFYAWRIWTLTKNKYVHGVAVLIMLGSLTQGLGAIIGAIVSRENPTQSTLIKMHSEFEVWWGGSLATDALITICMTYVLSQHKSRTTWKRSETMLTTLINRVVQTGAITVLCASVGVGLYLRFEHTTYHFVPAYILGKLYTNSLMLTLNLRRSRGQDNQTESNTLPMNSMRSQESRGGVHIERSTFQAGDKTLKNDTSGAKGMWSPKESQFSEHDLHEHRLNIVDMRDINRSETDLHARV
ncbi:hypothetical protein C8R43DRAFT_6088 [Mycena crocata]|nr:hypothetical protein C8R43DRAFT_6088 [Mycena crocata]